MIYYLNNYIAQETLLKEHGLYLSIFFQKTWELNQSKEENMEINIKIQC